MKESTVNRIAAIPGYLASAIGGGMIGVAALAGKTADVKAPPLALGIAGFLIVVVGVAIANFDQAADLLAKIRARIRQRRPSRPHAA